MTNTNFLGIPVEGDIDKGSKKTPQKPLAELEPLMRAVLADDYIDSFGWTQYTPYFNDGDACVFGVGEPWFRTMDDVKGKPASGDEDDEYYDEDDDDSFTLGYTAHPTLGKQDYEYDNPRDWENRRKVYGRYEGNRQSSFTVCADLADAINSGAFEDVLLEAFGDHAKVKVRATGITVDTYEHD
jgi:hypothetical protein